MPFAPTASPFQVKGSICRGCVEYVSDQVRGGLPAVFNTIEDAELKRYFEQSFLASSFYDVFALNAFMLSASKVAQLRYEVFLNQAFEAQAERDQRGVYKLLLSAISPEMLVKRLPRIGSQLFSFTRSEVRELGPGHWENAITGIPVQLQTVYCEASGAFVARALRTTGAKDLSHRWLPPRPAPSAHGLPIITVIRELRWRA